MVWQIGLKVNSTMDAEIINHQKTSKNWFTLINFEMWLKSSTEMKVFEVEPLIKTSLYYINLYI